MLPNKYGIKARIAGPHNKEPKSDPLIPLFPEMSRIITGITTGNYSSGQEIDQFLDPGKYPAEVVEFSESLGMMSVKLEARELALKNMITELERKNAELSDNIYKRKFLSDFFAGILLLVCCYVFVLSMLRAFPALNAYVSRGIEVSVVVFGVWIIKKSGIPLSDFGVTLKNWKKAIGESLLFTALSVGVMVIIRSWLHANHVKGFETGLIAGLAFSPALLLYLPISYVQEFISRGIMQTSIVFGFMHKRKKLMAVLITASIFGGSHAAYSYGMVFASFFFGLGWGFLYLRHKTLIGVGLAHFLTGFFAWQLGFWAVLTGQAF